MVPQIDHNLVHTRGRFAKVIGKTEHPVLGRGTHHKCVVMIRSAMQLHFRAADDYRREEPAIFKDFELLFRRLAGLVVLHAIRIGMRNGSLCPY
jgi:hypothetical protein